METDLLREFGKAILNEMTQMFARNSDVVIPFTEDSLKDICSNYDFDYKEVVSAFNAGFMNCGVNDYYVSLACCAFQVMVAYDCLASDSKSYNGKLVELIHTTKKWVGISDLQAIYATDFYYDHTSAKKQELLWEGARALLEKKELHLRIPNRTSNPGRYVQYPLKQRVIDRKTLQKYVDIFKERFKKKLDTSYSFEEFSKEVFKNSFVVNSSENKTLFFQKEANEIAKRIIFYCFCNWVDHEVRHRSPKLQNSSKNIFKVRMSDGGFDLFINEKKQQSPSFSVPLRPFMYDETYNEWIIEYSSIDASDNVTVGVVLDRSEWADNSLLKGASYIEWKYSPGRRFYINPTKYIERKGKEWFKRENIKFVGGIKDNDGHWILTLLPTITNVQKQNFIVIDHRSYPLKNGTFNLNEIGNMEAGIHLIRLFNRSPILFETVAPDRNFDLQRGWTWDKRQPHFEESVNGGAIISGLYTNVPSIIEVINSYWGNEKLKRLNDRYDRVGVISKIKGGING